MNPNNCLGPIKLMGVGVLREKDENSKPLIIIVDDDSSMGILVTKMLENNYRVGYFNCAGAFWSAPHKEIPDLILLDVMMPGENGFETAVKIKNHALMSAVSLIFLTAKVEPEELKKAFESGADDFLRKPFNRIELEVRIKSVLQRKKLENELRILSSYDELTRVYNRRFFNERLVEHLERSKRHQVIFSLAILDIDFFKKTNDRFGHQAGDFILEEFAKILQANIRPYDILARYGGEEFVVILGDCDKKTAVIVLERIKSLVRDRVFCFNGQKIKISFSGGLSDIGELNIQGVGNLRLIDSLVGLADNRLYQAKNMGRDQIRLD